MVGQERKVEATAPAISDKAKPLKDGIGKDDARTHNDSSRGQQHGPEPGCPRIDYSLGQRHPLADAQLNEIDKNDRVAHDDARARDEADHGSRSKECAHDCVSRHECRPASAESAP